MKESIEIFESFCQSEQLAHSHIFLLLNKTDKFRKKIQQIPLKNYFPDYEGGSDYEEALDFITRKFIKPDSVQSKKVRVLHSCCAEADGGKHAWDRILSFTRKNLGVMEEFALSPSVDMNNLKISNQTFLWRACSRGRREPVEIVLASTTNINVKEICSDGEIKGTASRVARERGYPELADQIDEYEKDPQKTVIELRRKLKIPSLFPFLSFPFLSFPFLSFPFRIKASANE